jgi:membrane associated rhomboid family serine protease
MTERAAEKFWHFLERRAPWLGTPGVLRAVVMLNALMFALLALDPDYVEMLWLEPEKIRQGEIWRLVTYIFIPQTQSMFWMFFVLLFMWFLANALEEAWGPLKLNVFYLTGMAGCTVAAFFFGGAPANTFLNLSLFFAFATLAPDYEIFLFFILRVKVKYLAWVFAAFLLLQMAAAPLAAKAAMVASLANYLLFFGPGFIKGRIEAENSRARRKKFAPAASDTLHRCAQCDRTEVSDPELEFRVSGDGQEYCLEHLPKREEGRKD